MGKDVRCKEENPKLNLFQVCGSLHSEKESRESGRQERQNSISLVDSRRPVGIINWRHQPNEVMENTMHASPGSAGSPRLPSEEVNATGTALQLLSWACAETAAIHTPPWNTGNATKVKDIFRFCYLQLSDTWGHKEARCSPGPGHQQTGR